jgi:hypothetical protein
MFHTWAITTGQKTSKVIAVGMACCPKIPTPASTLVPFACGSIFMFRAVFSPMMALKMPPRRMLTCTKSREELAKEVWGHTDVATSRVIDVHIRNTRAALEKKSSYRYIHTTRGLGYRFRAEPKNGTEAGAEELPE